jgi:exonuclease SbcD
MRFIHTADWHLGKRLHDFSLIEVQAHAVQRFIELVATSRPDAVVVAGDVFDTQVPNLGALELWEQAVEAIVGEHGVPMVVIPGNHDHADRLSAHAGLARRAGLHYVRSLADSVVPVTVAGVDFYGVPFHKPVHVRAAHPTDGPPLGDFDYAGAMDHALGHVRRVSATRTAPAVLVAHAFVSGAGDEPEGEDAISVGGAGGMPVGTVAGFDYVALGHIHRPFSLGGDGVQYSGSLYPYSFGEAGQDKSVALVELGAGGGVSSVERLWLDTVRGVRRIAGLDFSAVLAAAEHESVAQRDHYTLVQVTDTDPLTDGLAALRERYPHAVLEQPLITAPAWVPRLTGDYRTTTPEDALRQFHRHVFGEELSEIEDDVLRAALDLDTLGADGDSPGTGGDALGPGGDAQKPGRRA